jgi:glycosyltransferase involved in cell wall biosynthesis
MYRAVRKVRPAVAHFHDPELIPVGLALKFRGIKVVYDVHEDLPRQILGKSWLSPWLRRPVSLVAEAVEWVAGKAFDGIVAATPTIARRFPARKTVMVQNFPILSELVAPDSVPYEQRSPDFAYVGGLGKIRGSREMVEAISRIRDGSARLQFAGKFANAPDEEEARALEGWDRVNFHGWADRPSVARLLGEVRAGLVLFHSSPAHRNAQPNKMFEYMAAGLPVIASDFPLWREIVDGAGCGVLVDPLHPDAIAEAMQWILDYPDKAEVMGRRGRKAVEETYNWEPEAEKLIGLYRRLLQEQRP